MSDEPGYSRPVISLLFCLFGGPALAFFLVLGAVFVEEKAIGTHRIEEEINSLRLDAPFRWFTHKTGLGP